jgi:RimJ/RimL family protein N-acetyltransferase
MIFLPIDLNEINNNQYRNNPDCIEVLVFYPVYYAMVGYSPPWIGYFVSLDGKEVVGCAGYKGRPKDGAVEISYATFKKYEGQGIATETCRKLVELAKQTDPGLIIKARTLMEENASVKLLRRNGFAFKGIVFDEDDGNVWEWVFS